MLSAVLWAFTIGALIAATAILYRRASSPVGHWKSAPAQDRFLSAYFDAFALLPEPQLSIDVRTKYGFVRTYRFKGADSGTSPLLLLPGRASGMPLWADNLPALLRIGDVYAIDLLGEPGLSAQIRPILNDGHQAEWLAELLAALPEPDFHVVGYSIGGWTAVNLALHSPRKIRSLILIDPVQVFGDIPVETALRSIPASLPFTPKSWRDGFNSWTAGGAAVSTEPVAEMIEAGMAGYALKLPQPARIREERLQSVAIPVLAILAGRSVMHSGMGARAIAERSLKLGETRYYPEASHAINGEIPQQVADDIRRFITAPAQFEKGRDQ